MLKFNAALFIGIALSLGGCQETDPKDQPIDLTNTIEELPPISKYLSCLPPDAAILAAHRGTARRSKYPENSMSALKALLDKGHLITEVDVAGLKDGTHILYHDGVWEEKSTGKGSVAATTWKEAEKILLEDTRGKVSADRPTKLRDYLLTAKGKIYVEIDFKSSSKYEVVIKAIRAAEMADQVVLISYSAGQARKLSRLAPEMLISTTPEIALSKRRSKNNSYAAWLGYDLNNTTLMERLNNNDIPVLGRIREDWNRAAVAAADILITDYIFDHDPIIGLTKSKKAELEACLSRI